MPQKMVELSTIALDIADCLKKFDLERPVHKNFQPGIGPFAEPQLVKEISNRLNRLSDRYDTKTKRTPDMVVNNEWDIEFKIVRPFGDNGVEAENWSVNLLHPYPGNTSLIGDAIKLLNLNDDYRKALFVIGFEHTVARISLDPLLSSFEVIIRYVIGINIENRIEERRFDSSRTSGASLCVLGSACTLSLLDNFGFLLLRTIFSKQPRSSF